MTWFLISLLAFIALHVGVSGSGLRAGLVARIGAGAYRVAFSVASIGLLAAMLVAYGQARGGGNPVLWTPAAPAVALGMALSAAGVWLAVMAYLQPNPTAVGMDFALRKADPATGIVRVTRHPFLWGVALWAAGHVLANGDAATVALAAGLGVMVLLGTASIDRKTAERDPQAWARLAAVTSNTPFAAVLQGRARLVPGELWWRGLIAAGATAAVWAFHGAIAGVALRP